VLRLAVSYERGEWAQADALGRNPAELSQAYGDAVAWTTEQLAAGQAT
jgi:hypothetical protein